MHKFCWMAAVLLGSDGTLMGQELWNEANRASPLNFVAVSHCGSRLLLATPKDGQEWRSEVLDLPEDGRKILDFELSRGGTKLAILDDHEHVVILDLTIPFPI